MLILYYKNIEIVIVKINKDRTDQDHLFDKVLHGKATEEIFKVSEIFNFLKF